MSKKLKTSQEIEAWDRYYVAALNAVASPGALKGVSTSVLKDFLEEAAEMADKMLVIRSARDPKV